MYTRILIRWGWVPQVSTRLLDPSETLSLRPTLSAKLRGGGRAERKGWDSCNVNLAFITPSTPHPQRDLSERMTLILDRSQERQR